MRSDTSQPGSIVDCVEATAAPILEIGRAWMLSPATLAHGTTLGLSPDSLLDFWVNGRAGVLGDGPASKAAAAIAFVGPDLVARYWDARPEALSAPVAAAHYAVAGAKWGHTAFASITDDDATELALLCRKVIGRADPSIGSLFAGWREIDLPTEPREAMTVALNQVRELRGAAHLHAVFACGLTPLEAIMSVDDPVYGGATRAEFFGWPEPYPAPNFEARGRCEAMTSEILGGIYALAFSDSDADRFTALVLQAQACLA